jgi:hypothetical protein
MLPEFDQYGNLPIGIHRCSTEELVERFGDEDDFHRWANEDFGTDRDDRRKGIVEVIL